MYVLCVGSGPAQRMGSAPCSTRLVDERISNACRISEERVLFAATRYMYLGCNAAGRTAARGVPFAARNSHGVGLHSLIARLPRLIRSRRAEIDTFAAMLVGDTRRTSPLCHQHAHRRVGCD